MHFNIFLSSPLIVIIDPLFLKEETVDYILKMDVVSEKPWSLALKINKALFPYGGSIVGLYEVQNFIQGEWVLDVSEIFRVFKEDFQEYDLSEECLFGVDSGEILVIEFDYLKWVLKDFSEKTLDYFLIKDKLFSNEHTQQSKFCWIEAFDINNTFTDFIGDGRYAISEDFIKYKSLEN